MTDEVRQQRNAVIRNLVATLDSYLPGESGHAMRVAIYSVATGENLGLDEDRLLKLRYAAELHDIGKLAISHDIWSQQARISETSRQAIQTHPELCAEYLSGHDWLLDTSSMIAAHHERTDGSGYPRALSGDQIPLEARIIAVAETFDAMTRDQRYRVCFSDQQALTMIQEGSGGLFDPVVVEAFLQVQKLIQPVESS